MPLFDIVNSRLDHKLAETRVIDHKLAQRILACPNDGLRAIRRENRSKNRVLNAINSATQCSVMLHQVQSSSTPKACDGVAAVRSGCSRSQALGSKVRFADNPHLACHSLIGPVTEGLRGGKRQLKGCGATTAIPPAQEIRGDIGDESECRPLRASRCEE